MKRSEPYILDIYRLDPGDGPAMPPIIGDLPAAEEQASQRLLVCFNDKSLPENKRPYKAQLTQAGKVVLRLRITPAKKVERVEERDMLGT